MVWGASKVHDYLHVPVREVALGEDGEAGMGTARNESRVVGYGVDGGVEIPVR